IEFTLGMQVGPEAFRACLRAAAEGSASSSLISDCLLGNFGHVGQTAIINDANKMLLDCERELEVIDVHLNEPAEGRDTFVFEVRSPIEWSAYAIALMQAAARCV